jgi:hypothetical protein
VDQAVATGVAGASQVAAWFVRFWARTLALTLQMFAAIPTGT